MQTIEERYGCSNCQCPSCEGCSIWDKVEGATEQKAIDDTELHQRFEKVLNGQKWDLIDKACEWLKAYDITFTETPSMLEDFRRAMGEMK